MRVFPRAFAARTHGRTLMRTAAALALLALVSPALAGPSDDVALPTPEAVAAEVDALMEKAWKAAGVEPAGPASDAVFLRRASLDIQGVIPDEARVRAFLADERPGKRREMIRTLLQEVGFARFTGLRWAYLLVGRDYLYRSLAVKKLAQMQGRMGAGYGGMSEEDAEDRPVPPLVAWLEDRLQANAPWDGVVRDLVSAKGSADENYATHYLIRHLRDGKAEELAGSAMRLFQGLQIQCAQCHDHPYTAWKQTDFYGIAAFFSRAGARRRADMLAKDGKGAFEVVDRADGQIRIPVAGDDPRRSTGQLVLPRFATGAVIPPGRNVERRDELARLLTAPENPWFAKAMVNRFWSFLFGRGLANPVDDLEVGTVEHPEVLERLARDFRESGYDVRRLYEVMASTRAYQLASGGKAEGRDEQLALAARMPLRQLSAEQLFFSVLEATATADTRTANPRERARLERLKLGVLRQFLQTFADDEAEEVVEEGTIPQALLLLNGPLSNDAVRPRQGHPLYDRLFQLQGTDARIETIWLRVLGRPATADERKAVEELLRRPESKAAAGQASAWSDVIWALLNSPEFALNH